MRIRSLATEKNSEQLIFGRYSKEKLHHNRKAEMMRDGELGLRIVFGKITIFSIV